MSSVKNILSIDFDKFLTKEVKWKTEQQNKVKNHFNWLKDYAKNNEYLDIDVKHQEIIDVLKTLLKLPQNTTVLIADTHANIVPMFRSITKDFYEKDVTYNIYNVDHHHDIFYTNIAGTEERDFHCANWVSYLHNHDKLNNYTWICNEDSKQYKGKLKLDSFNVTSDLSTISDLDFDAVFVCVSSSWIPLHLYQEFTNFIGVLNIHFTPTMTDEITLNPMCNSSNFEKKSIERILDLYSKVKAETTCLTL